MILAGLTLLAVGAADLLRQFVIPRRRWIAYSVGAVLLFSAAVAVDAAGWAIAACLVAALWIAVVRPDGSGAAGLWPAAILGVLVATSVVLAGPRSASLAFGELWMIDGPHGSVPVDLLVLVAGSIAFLAESTNTIVRSALRAEAEPSPSEESTDARPATLKGGRLIGPLERILVFALTLAGAYTLIAAVLAAKGIVRFPEISRDSRDGNRAEYFLIGSLVSWVVAFATAFLVWWGTR